MARMFLSLSLIAVLSGPLLRQAEGAGDLIRSLAELGCPPVLEEVDGGVGDDSGAMILSPAAGAMPWSMTPGRFEPAAVTLLAAYQQPSSADIASVNSRQAPPRSEGAPAPRAAPAVPVLTEDDGTSLGSARLRAERSATPRSIGTRTLASRRCHPARRELRPPVLVSLGQFEHRSSSQSVTGNPIL